MRESILILGMHRSGTSALARTCNLLGAAEPKNLLPPNEFNPRGYWECQQLCESHDNLLASVKSSWDDCQRLDPQRLAAEANRLGHRQRIKNAISQAFDDAPLFVLKDPRICRFVPLTLSILDELKVRPLVIIPVRNPIEVAASLQQRDGFSRTKGLNLWLRHVLDAEYSSRAIPRFFVRYEDLLLDWRTCLARAADITGLAWPGWSGELEQAIDQFLTVKLRRRRASTEQLQAHPEVGSWIKDTYAIVSRMAESGAYRPDLDRLDLIRSKFDEVCTVMGPALKENEALVAQKGDRLVSLQATRQVRSVESQVLRHELRKTQKTQAALRHRMWLLTDSFCWRAGKPLRALGAKFPPAATFFKRLLQRNLYYPKAYAASSHESS